MSRRLELAGRKFGSLLVKDKWYSKNGNIYWQCECDCGKLVDVIADNLTGGRTKHCVDCGHKVTGNKKRLKLAGKVFNSLIVLKEVTKDGDRRTSWLCKCLCGKEFEVPGHQLVSAHTKRCRSCGYEAMGHKRKDGELSKGIWSKIIHGALSRKIDVLITREGAYNLFLSQGRKCALSGIELKLKRDANESRTLVTASLDRIDSSLPYTMENVQWVHKDLNLMKRSLSQASFVGWCEKVVEFQKDKNVVAKII